MSGRGVRGLVVFSRSRWPLWLLLLLLALGAGLWAHRGLLVAGVLLRVERARDPAWLVHYGEQAVREHELPEGRLYAPTSARGAILLAHGMHAQGIEEPRLIGLARALAGAGYTVLTPRMTGLQHYQLTRADVRRIGATAQRLAAWTKRPRVTVFGISFGGGMAIRAACEGAPAIERVVALGAHHDAERVSRFYLGEPAPGPDGAPAQVEPHPYGRVALWRSLFGRDHVGSFQPAERAQILAGIEAHRTELRAVSPRGCSALTVPLFLLHGSDDRVVPSTETLWNERELAPQAPVRSLISPAIMHAEYDPPSLRERLSLIAFLVNAWW
jgi:pimeloyl-ACP methyl ester carboxylesterase